MFLSFVCVTGNVSFVQKQKHISMNYRPSSLIIKTEEEEIRFSLQLLTFRTKHIKQESFQQLTWCVSSVGSTNVTFLASFTCVLCLDFGSGA